MSVAPLSLVAARQIAHLGVYHKTCRERVSFSSSGHLRIAEWANHLLSCPRVSSALQKMEGRLNPDWSQVAWWHSMIRSNEAKERRKKQIGNSELAR